jgi:hypothetical protein
MFSYLPSLISLAGDNLVSRGSGSASAAMSLKSGIGSGSTINDLLDAILWHLDSMEEKLQPLGRHLAGVGGDVDFVQHAVNDSGKHGAGLVRAFRFTWTFMSDYLGF